MPNVSPRGVHVFDPAGTRRPAVNVYIADPAAGVNRKAVRVWVWDPTLTNALPGVVGDWAIAWADAATPPATVTASYVAAGTSVTVSWTAPVPRVADQWQIARPDGSVVATVPYTTLTLSDGEPRPLNGAYTVRGVLAGALGPTASSNSLDLRLPPATFTASWNASLQRVDFAGTAPTLGAPDSYNYYRVMDGGFIGSNSGLAGAPTGWDGDPGGFHRGYVQKYEVRSVLGGVESSLGTQTANVNVPPLPPRPQYLIPINNTCGMRLGFFGPPAGTATNYHVQTWQNGTWTDRGTGFTSGIFDWTATINLGPVYARVSTVAPGGESDFVQIGPVNPSCDVTAPGDVNWHSFQPESSYGRMVMRAQLPSDADLVYAQIERYAPDYDPGWTVLWASGVSPGQELALDCGTLAANQQMFCRVYLRDATGNARYSSERNYTTVPSPTSVFPDDTTYWAANVYNAAGDGRPRQGPGVVGLFCYGTKILAAMTGHQVWGIEAIIVQRSGGSGATVLDVHDKQTIPANGAGAAPALAGLDYVLGSQAAGQTLTNWLDQSFLLNWAFNGYYGLATFWNYAGAVSKVFQSNFDNAFSGLLQLHHLG